MKEQRRSARYRHELPVDLFEKRSGVSNVRKLRAVDVARHGIFIVTDDPPRERHLVQLAIHLPDGPIRAAASVTRVIVPHPNNGIEPGAGVQFFALSDDDKQRWDDFIFQLQRTTPPQGVRAPDLSKPPEPEPERPVGGSSGATFLVKLKSVERLQDFVSTHVAAGGTVLFTPVLRTPGDSVTMVVVHPKTDEEFKLPGVVARAITERPKRLEIHFLGLTPAVMNALRAFVETGRPPAQETQPTLPPTTLVPQLATNLAPQDFEIDVDVFDEDTLDTDDRIGAMHLEIDVDEDFEPSFAPPLQPIKDIQERRAVPDPSLKPDTFRVRCGACDADPYAIDLGPCRGVLGLVADHAPFVASDGRVVATPRLVSAEVRAVRVQAFLEKGGMLNASVDLMTLLGAVGLTEPPPDPGGGKPMKSSRALERLEAAAHKHEAGTPAARTKVHCPKCKTGSLTIERTPI